jgi:acyl-CoA synthetase (AMP-forming)/AMP-acid ligase II
VTRPARADVPGSPVPASLLDEAETLTGALAALALRFPDFRCLVTLDRRGEEQTRSLGELWERAQQIRAGLEGRGLGPGGVVILILPTGPELVAAYFGVLLCGGVPGLVATPSNRVADHDVYATRVGAILANASAHTLYCSPDVAAIFTARPHLLAGAALRTPDDAAAGGGASPALRRPDDVATIQYSSGSTGVPKGILLTHRAMLNNIRAVRDGLGLTARDVSVNWIPLYHDMGLIDAFLLPLLGGCPTVLIPTMDFMRDPGLWLRALHRYRGAISWAPNFAYHVTATRVPEAELEGLDLSGWRIAINAAEPLLARTLETFTRRFAPHGFRPEAMTPAWGLAENVTIATAHPVSQAPRVEHVEREALATRGVAQPCAKGGVPSVAIGRCLPGCELEIRDASGARLPDRRVGSIWLRSNSLLRGYHGDPEQTRRVLVDGWLDTGDHGYLAEGDLFFVSREKDLIVIGGEKYSPHDIETLVNEVPGVRAGCAVAFGILSEERGTEELAAVIETRETGEAAAALERSVRDRVLRKTGLALRHVVLVPPGGVEKTTSGKLARRATKARHAARLPQEPLGRTPP